MKFDVYDTGFSDPYVYTIYDVIKHFKNLGINENQLKIDKDDIFVDLSIENEYIEMDAFDGHNRYFRNNSFKFNSFKSLNLNNNTLVKINRLKCDGLKLFNTDIIDLHNFPQYILPVHSNVSVDLSHCRRLQNISEFCTFINNDMYNTIDLNMCKMLNNLIGLQSDYCGSLSITHTDIDSLDKIPYNVIALSISDTPIKSFASIDKFKNVTSLYAKDLEYYTDVVNVLLCNCLTKIVIGTNDVTSPKKHVKSNVFEYIMMQYIANENKKDFTMDCTIALINAGFENII